MRTWAMQGTSVRAERPPRLAARITRFCAALIGLGVAAGCGGRATVVRVYDGRIVEEAAVAPDAYAEYLRGALAEEKGDLRTALSHYERVLAFDDEDAEVFARIGDVRCRLDP